MHFDNVKEEHRLIAYDITPSFWQKLSDAMADGFKEVLVESDRRKVQELCDYYTELTGTLTLKRANLIMDTMKQDQTEYEVGYAE